MTTSPFYLPQYPLCVPPDEPPSVNPHGLVRVGAATSGKLEVANDTGEKWGWRRGMSGRHHFWSTDGIECLWCAGKRTPEEIRAWFEAGQPKEECL